MSLSTVAIVGRPNVGKSSFLNAAVRRRVSIVHDIPGVTRDRIEVELSHGERVLRLVDMGGIGIVDDQDLDLHIEMQINAAIGLADVLLFLVDVREGLVVLDTRVADIIRRTGKPCILAANKVDAEKHRLMVDEFHGLGLGRPLELSAKEGFGVSLVLDALVDLLPPPSGKESVSEEGEALVALVGQRNAGKSTLLNTLAGEERVIVSELPGTTRDAVDVRIRVADRVFTAIDTAGARKPRKVANSIEFYGQVRTLESIRRAHVVLHLMDATREISQVDKKVASAILEARKPCVIVVNKWDLAEDVDPEHYLRYLEGRLPLLHYAPVVFVSAKQGTRLRELIRVTFDIHDQAGHRIPTAQVNKAIEEAATVRGPRVSRGRYPKIYFATQVGVHPPWIVLFVNDPKLFKDDFRRFLENRLRRAFPFREIPIRISFRQRESLYR